MSRGTWILGGVLLLALGGTVVHAQKNAGKQTESLTKASDGARKSIEDVVTHLGRLLEGYNAIIDGSAKNVQSSYKKLSGDLKETEKKLQGARKSVDAMKKEADKYFANWEKDLAGFTSEDMKQKSQARLDASKARYAALGDALAQARDAFAPVVQNLNDQVLFLGRDLSPDAIADLQDEAAQLNEQVRDVTDKVRSLLASGEAGPATVEEPEEEYPEEPEEPEE